MSVLIKVWSSDRIIKKLVAINSSEDFAAKVRCKFGLTSDKVVCFVYENDGTEVDEVDFEIIKHLAESNTILILLIDGQQWTNANLPISNSPLVLPSLQPNQSTLLSSITFSESSVPVNNSHLMKTANEAFVSANSIKAFLAQHPSTCQYTEEVDSGKVSISTRQHIIRTVVHKMMSVYGNYPDRYQKISVAAVLSEALVLPACIFYDSTNHHGFLERGLENARRKLPGSQKKFVWSRKRGHNLTRCNTTQLADPELAELSQSAGSSVELQNPEGCPRGFMSCTLCLGMSNLDEIEKLDSLSSTRVEEIKASTKSTFCFRQNWVHSSDQPSLSRLMLKFPKFRIIPELIDMEFRLKYSDCMVDILKTFNQTVSDPIIKYALMSNSVYIKDVAVMVSKKHYDWKAYYACKLLCSLLRQGGKLKRSAPEVAMEIIRICSAEHGLQNVAEKLESPYPVILLQGVEGEKILSIKIAAEKTLLEAGTSIVEGIDRLFKLFWCFNIEYHPSTIMFWQFLQDIYGLQYGSMSNGVVELRSTLAKYV